MNIKAVVSKLTDREDNLLGMASVTFEDYGIKMNDIRILEGKNGGKPWVAFPARKRNDGGFQDVVHPVTQESREAIIKAIMDEYNKK